MSLKWEKQHNGALHAYYSCSEHRWWFQIVVDNSGRYVVMLDTYDGETGHPEIYGLFGRRFIELSSAQNACEQWVDGTAYRKECVL